MEQGTARVPVRKISLEAGPAQAWLDVLAVEEPLEVRLAWRERDALRERTIAITMRTPGHDRELGAGFLFGEGIVRRREDIAACEAEASVVRVELATGVPVDLRSLERNFYVTSSCGVCGKASLDAVRVRRAYATPEGPSLDARVVVGMPATLRAASPRSRPRGACMPRGSSTRGAPCTRCARTSDVTTRSTSSWGRPCSRVACRSTDRILMLSGRASFELVQKAAMAGAPVVAAVGAPSSLAVELARESGLTLLGFVRDLRFNVYAGFEARAGRTQ